MKTLLGKKWIIHNVVIIILVVSNILAIIAVFYPSYFRILNINKLKYYDQQAVFFYHITDGKDTILIQDILLSVEDDMNFKVPDWKIFEYHFMKKILNNEIIEVSEEYMQQQKPYSLKPIDAIDNLYNNHGVDSLVNYLNEKSSVIYMDLNNLNSLFNIDKASFRWAIYLLWKNGIYVSFDEDVWHILNRSGKD
jgi:hypothetical protein